MELINLQQPKKFDFRQKLRNGNKICYFYQTNCNANVNISLQYVFFVFDSMETFVLGVIFLDVFCTKKNNNVTGMTNKMTRSYIMTQVSM